jgi:hypothetical protein
MPIITCASVYKRGNRKKYHVREWRGTGTYEEIPGKEVHTPSDFGKRSIVKGTNFGGRFERKYQEAPPFDGITVMKENGNGQHDESFVRLNARGKSANANASRLAKHANG